MSGKNGESWDPVMLRIAFTKGLNNNERAVLTGLALDGDWKTGEYCSPTLEWLAEYLDMGRTVLIETLQRLEKNGWTIGKRRHRQPTIYTINTAKLGTRPKGAKASSLGFGFRTQDQPLSPESGPKTDELSDPLESGIRTQDILESGIRTQESDPESGIRTPEAVLASGIRTPFPSTYVPYQVQDPHLQDPDPYQEPALRAVPKESGDATTENPDPASKAKANPDPAFLAKLRSQIRPAPAPISHRQRARAAARA